MKIKKEVLKDFLRKVSLNGHMNKVIALDLAEDGMNASNLDNMNITLYTGKIKMNSIADYNPIGKIGIVDVKFLRSIVDRLYTDITIDIGEEGVLLKSGTKKILIALADTDNLELHEFPKNLKPTIELNIPTVKLKEVLADTIVFGEKSYIEFRMEKNCMKFIVGEDSRKETMEDSIMCEYSGPVISARYFRDHIENVITTLSTKEVLVSFADNHPLIIKEDTGSIKGTFLVAPFTEKEDVEEKEKPKSESKEEPKPIVTKATTIEEKTE